MNNRINLIAILGVFVAATSAMNLKLSANAQGKPRSGKVVGGSRVVLRQLPDDSSDIVAHVKLGVDINETERSGEWSHVEMPSGRSAWVRTLQIRYDKRDAISINVVNTAKPGVPAGPIDAATPHGAARLTAISSEIPPAKLSGAAKTTAPTNDKSKLTVTTGSHSPMDPAKSIPLSLGGTGKTTDSAPLVPTSETATSGWLAQAKPDGALVPQSTGTPAPSPMKFMLYLIPVLAITLFAVRALKVLQNRSGEIPVSKKSIISSFNLIKSRKSAGSNIKIVESTSVGSVSLHLVEIRGRLLLIGSSGSSITMLGDFSDQETVEPQAFGSVLEGYMAGAPGAFDTSPYASQSAVVNSLDDTVRGTLDTMQDSISRSMERARLFHERYRGESANGARKIG